MIWPGRRVSLLLCYALVLAAPLPFGAASPEAIAALALAVAIALCGAIRDRHQLAAPVNSWWWLAATTLALAWVQFVPLPTAVVGLLSPGREHAARAVFQLEPPTEPEQLLRNTQQAIDRSLGVEQSSTSWLPLSADIDAGMFGTLRLSLGLGAFLLGLLLATTPSSRRGLALTIGISAGFQALYGLAEALTHHHQIFGYAKTEYLPLPSGTFICPNHWAALLSLGLFCLLPFVFLRDGILSARSSHGERFAHRVLIATALGVVFIAMVWSSSRAGLAAAAFGCAILALSLRWGQPPEVPTNWAGRTLVGLSLLLAVATAIWIRPPQALGRDLARSAEDLPGRTLIWQSAWSAAGEFRWVGSGIGTYPIVQTSFRLPELGARASHAHNDYLEWLCETGVVGAALLLAWLLVVGRAVIKLLRHDQDRWLTCAFTAALIALGLHETADFSLQLGGVLVPAAMLAGTLISPLAWGPRSEGTRPLSRAWSGLLLVVAGSAAGCSLWLLFQPAGGPWPSPEAIRKHARGALIRATSSADSTESSIESAREAARTAWRASQQAVWGAPFRVEATLTHWRALQLTGAVLAADRGLPERFLDLSGHWLRRAEQLDPWDRTRRLALVDLWLLMGEEAQATRLVRELLRVAPERAEAAFELLGGADADLTRLMAATPSEPKPAFELARYLGQRQDWVGASIVLERATSRHPEDPLLAMQQAAVLRQRGLAEQAAVQLAQHAPPADPMLRRQWAWVEAEIAIDRQDGPGLERAIEARLLAGADPESCALLRARLARRQGRLAKVIELLTPFLDPPTRVWPQEVYRLEALITLGQALNESGSATRAIEYFRAARELAPHNPAVRAFFQSLAH